LIAAAIILALRVRRKGIGMVSCVVSFVVCGVAVATVAMPTGGETVLGDGITILHKRDDTIVILDDPGPARFVLERLRLAGVRQPVLIIVRDGDRADADAVIALHERFGPVPTAAPPLHRVPGARTVEAGRRIWAGSFVITFVEVTPRLEVDISPAA
jgi:hypothetical protein